MEGLDQIRDFQTEGLRLAHRLTMQEGLEAQKVDERTPEEIYKLHIQAARQQISRALDAIAEKRIKDAIRYLMQAVLDLLDAWKRKDSSHE